MIKKILFRFAAELGVMKISIPDVVQLLLSKFSETVRHFGRLAIKISYFFVQGFH